ncbi:MAG: pyridoxal phosphate-dependent aminotransferase [Acidobacteriota bacterium]
MNLSRRVAIMQESPIRRLAPLMVEARRRGVRIHHLNIGQPDIPTPAPYLEAVAAFRERERVLAYGPSDGLPELRQAVADYFQRFGIPLDSREVMITSGGSEAALFAFLIVADHGDEIVVPQPFYTNYNGFAAMAGVRLVPVTTHAEDGFRLPPREVLERAIGPRTRAILVCSPNNPTGTILTAEELEMLADLAVRHDLFLIGDEVYKEFTYDGLKHTSILQLSRIQERAIVLDSVSKRFSACGARVGALISRNRKVMEAALKLGQARLCPPTIEQVGAVAAYRMDPSYFDPIRAEYQARRDTLCRGLTAHPGVLLRKPPGAFYMIVRLPLGDTDHFARWLLSDWQMEGETVMVAPGDGFYATPGLGQNEIRVAYVLKVPKLERAARILLEGMERYRTLERNGEAPAAGA